MVRLVLAFSLALVVGLQGGISQQALNESDKEVVNLKFELDSFGFLVMLDLNKTQKEKLGELVKEKIAFEVPAEDPPKYSATYLKKLRELRGAYIANNEELVDDLLEALSEIEEKEPVEIEYNYEVTAISKQNAKKFLNLLQIDQLADLISISPIDFERPSKMLFDAFREIPDLKGEEKQNLHDDILESVVISLAGVDLEKESKIRKEIELYLNDIMKLSPLKDDAKVKERKARNQPFIERANKIVGEIGVMEILQNNVEYFLAKQLSNPQFANALSKLPLQVPLD